MKRANRLLFSMLTKTEYQLLIEMWRQHLRWMRLHLAYFKPLPPILHSKRRKKEILDILTDMALKGLKNEDCVPPDLSELRRVLRLYVRSSNRGREGRNSVPEMLKFPNHFGSTWFLAQWVIARTRVEHLR